MQRRYRVLRTRRGYLYQVPPASPAPAPPLIRRSRTGRYRPRRQRALLPLPGITPSAPSSAVFWAGEARGRWTAGGLSVYTQSVLSTAYVQVPVTAYGTAGTYDPTGDAVQFAFTAATYPVTSPSSWTAGSWATFPGPAYWAQCLVGPGTGGTALSIGTYQIWLKITSNPEVPVLQPSLLEITP